MESGLVPVDEKVFYFCLIRNLRRLNWNTSVEAQIWWQLHFVNGKLDIKLFDTHYNGIDKIVNFWNGIGILDLLESALCGNPFFGFIARI